MTALLWAGLVTATGAGGVGCKREEPTQPDRTLEKLREEVDREQRGLSSGRAPGTPEDPNAKLAALATGDGAPQDLPLPEGAQTAQLGTVAVRATRLQVMHSVRAGRVELTSEDGFLAVTVLAQNTGTEPVEVDFSHVALRDAAAQGNAGADAAAAGETHRLAMDAQRGGTWPLQRTIGPGDRQELTLYFEVPAQTLRQGLVLNVAAGAAPGAAADVQLPLGTGR